MKIKNIIFDLYGVLFFLNVTQILKQIGIWNTIRFALRYKTMPYHYYYILLEKMRQEMPGEYQDNIAFQGKFLPQSLCLWQKGKIGSNEALEKVQIFLEELKRQEYFQSSWEYILFERAFESAYLIQNRIPMMQPNKKLIREIKKLKNKKCYKIFMLTNIDHELFEKLNQLFPDIFLLFDDIITSCDTHLIKPQEEIFEYLVNKHQLNIQECLFFDDQQENIDMAKKLGMQAILYSKKTDVLKYLP